MRRIPCALAILAAACLVAPQRVTAGKPPSTQEPPVVVGGEVEKPAASVGERDGVPLYRKEFLSPIYTVDRIYRSMMGPKNESYFPLERDGEPELLWIKGYRAMMVTADGEQRVSQEFMCHSNLNVNPTDYHKRFPTRVRIKGPRLFTLSQGQLDIQLPDGFGIPMMSNQPLQLVTQVLNHNHEDETFQVRHNVSLDFVRDGDLEEPLTPLIPRGVQAMVLVEGPDGYPGVDPSEVDPSRHGEGCGLGEHVVEGERALTTDSYGRKFSGFWVVKPGRQTNKTLVTQSLGLPYDTTVHYIASHLHPFAESLELRDLTAGKTVYKTKTRQFDKGVGLAEVEYYSSQEGLPLYANHEYELIVVYNNTSGVDQDSMAVMFLYLRAKDLYDFDFRPVEAAPRRRQEPAADG